MLAASAAQGYLHIYMQRLSTSSHPMRKCQPPAVHVREGNVSHCVLLSLGLKIRDSESGCRSGGLMGSSRHIASFIRLAPPAASVGA
eukprot:2647984-Rhodomonas_salina.1